MSAAPAPDAGRPLLELRGVSVDFGGPRVLEDVSLALAPGAFVGVVGPSGGGKSTLLRVILGSADPRRGEVERRRGLRIGYVPQVETIDWSFPVTVDDVVLMSRRTARRLSWPRPSATERRVAAQVLDRLGIGDLGRRHIRQLSGGQQQRVFVARALVGEPEMLLLDEPTSGVDVRTRHEVLHLLSELHAGGLAILLTTHDLNGLATHLPELVCLNRRVTGRGAPHDVLTSEVLEATYGAPMDVLEHAGLPLVVDRHGVSGVGAHDSWAS